MVLTARLASGSVSAKPRPLGQGDDETPQVIYQKALKLLQDPILPVRAHGLLLLRQLVTPTSRKVSNANDIGDALMPAIISIFLESIQDDDSYMFLNAVQGLAAMVDRFGKEVMRGLIKEYADGLGGLQGTNLTHRELDIRVRIGEALASAIRRCGGALGIYGKFWSIDFRLSTLIYVKVDILLPPLLNILGSAHIPTTLRMSCISLLAECVKTNLPAMAPYLTGLISAMVDLLQIETVPAKPRSSVEKNDDTETPTIDTEPIASNTKYPALRRAAIHFISLAIQETTQQIYDSAFENFPLSLDLMRRAKTILSYVASTDEDNTVQVMAREADHGLDQAMFGT